MGNSNSNSHHHSHRNQTTVNQVAVQCFNRIAEERPTLNEGDLMRLLGPKIGSSLWKSVFQDRAEVKQDEFLRHFYELSDIQAEQCSKMFPSIEEFLDACLSTVDKTLKDEHSDFVSSLIQDANKDGGAHFFSVHCPGLAENTIIQRIKNVFCPSNERVVFAVESTILSPLQMLLVQGSLSEMVYFKNKKSKRSCWSKLYESNSQGLSVNRFEANVFGYSSPTVSIFKLTNKKIFTIANNTEWRHTTKYLGSPLTKCVQLAPHFKFIDSRHEEPIMCNFKFRTASFGLGFRDVFTINGDFDNVDSIEVWGCGNEQSLKEQQSLKQRQRMQAERNQKVPLPGQWDENPDKQLLEMAGFQFSSERNCPEPPHDDME